MPAVQGTSNEWPIKRRWALKKQSPKITIDLIHYNSTPGKTYLCELDMILYFFSIIRFLLNSGKACLILLDTFRFLPEPHQQGSFLPSLFAMVKYASLSKIVHHQFSHLNFLIRFLNLAQSLFRYWYLPATIPAETPSLAA